MTVEGEWLHPDSIVWELPGEPIHPADVMMAKMRHERRMREIRELDLDEWIASHL